MLRKFVNCVSRFQRLALVENSKVEDWSPLELDSVMSIMGLDSLNDGNLTSEQKYLTIYSYLKFNLAA